MCISKYCLLLSSLFTFLKFTLFLVLTYLSPLPVMHLCNDSWAPLQFYSHHCQGVTFCSRTGHVTSSKQMPKKPGEGEATWGSQHRSLTDPCQVPLVPMAGDRNQQSCTGYHQSRFPSTGPPPPAPATGGGTACLSHALNSWGELETRARVCIWQSQQGKKNGKQKFEVWSPHFTLQDQHVPFPRQSTSAFAGA